MDTITKLKQLYEDRAVAMNTREGIVAQDTISSTDRARDAELKAKIDYATERIAELEALQQEHVARNPGTLVTQDSAFSTAPARPQAPKPGARTYRQLFPHIQPTMNGFSGMTDFLDAARRGADARLTEQSYSATYGSGSGSLGGYAVPSELSAQTLDAMIEGSVILQRARIVPMATSKVSFWGMKNSNQTSGNCLGGIVSEWVAEGASFTDASGEVRAVNLEAKKVGLYTSVPNELLMDSAFEQEVTARFSEAAAFELDDALIHGTGAGQVVGLLNVPSKVAQAEESTQTNATIIFENIINMMSRCTDTSRAVWIVNQDTIPQLFTITMANAGLVQLIQGTPGGGFSIMGIPVIQTTKASTLGTEGDIILADLSRFLVGVRSDFAVQASTHVDFQSDKTAFRLIGRFDSADSFDAAITPRHSSTTLGWCVTLATRS